MGLKLYPDGIVVVGQKIWVKALDSTDNVAWVYALPNSFAYLRRIGIV